MLALEDRDLVLELLALDRTEAWCAFGALLAGSTKAIDRVNARATRIESDLGRGRGTNFICELPSYLISAFDAHPDFHVD
jgi:hypothetical protein